MTSPKTAGPVLIVGASGTLGAAVAAAVERSGRQAICATRRGDGATAPLDLATAAETWPLPAGVVVAHLCAAVTSIADCRARPEVARAVNVDGTVALAGRLVAAGSRVVFPSTNMVFDGESPLVDRHAAASPQTFYGRMKAEAERRLRELGNGVRIVRLSKVLGRRVPLFEAWRTALAAGQPIHPFSDMVIAPVSVAKAVETLVKAGDSVHGGVYQLSARADVSYANIARRLAGIMRADAGLVQPRTVAEAGVAVEHIARHTTLGVGGAEAELGISAPDPWQAIDEALAP